MHCARCPERKDVAFLHFSCHNFSVCQIYRCQYRRSWSKDDARWAVGLLESAGGRVTSARPASEAHIEGAPQ